MEKFKIGLRSLSEESNSDSSAFNTSRFPSEQSRILIRANPGRVVSLWTCSKMCAISFVVGIFVGFTLKRRFRRWASKLLRKIKDD